MATSMRQMKKNKQQAQGGVPSQQGGGGVLSSLGAQGEGKKLPPQVQAQIDTYNTATMKFIHSKETQKQILDMLKAGDPVKAVPPTALVVNEQVKGAMGGKVSTDVQLGASVGLVTQLIEVGIAAGLYEQPSDEDISFIYQDSLQLAVEQGLKDGSIDPIELQQNAEKYMTEGQQAAGGAMMEANGVSPEPDQRALIEQYANSKVDAANKKKGGMLNG